MPWVIDARGESDETHILIPFVIDRIDILGISASHRATLGRADPVTSAAALLIIVRSRERLTCRSNVISGFKVANGNRNAGPRGNSEQGGRRAAQLQEFSHRRSSLPVMRTRCRKAIDISVWISMLGTVVAMFEFGGIDISSANGI